MSNLTICSGLFVLRAFAKLRAAALFMVLVCHDYPVWVLVDGYEQIGSVGFVCNLVPVSDIDILES